jgi:glutathione S-transferase
MIELIQFPWSPYCLVQKRILDFSGVRYKTTNILPSDRSLIWKLTRERYYQVPIVRRGRDVIFETDQNSQVIAKFLDSELDLGLFPHRWDGIQDIMWQYIDNDVEGLTFRLNDGYFEKFVPKAEQLDYRRFKERKFGRHCLDQWRGQSATLLEDLVHRVMPFEQMLAHRNFLLEDTPRFVDFNLWGMLANFLHSGAYKMPAALPQVARWYERMRKLKLSDAQREKLHS